MKTYKMVKGNVTFHVRIGKETAEMKKQVGDQHDTTVTALTPLEANRRVNDLMRQGYVRQK